MVDPVVQRGEGAAGTTSRDGRIDIKRLSKEFTTGKTSTVALSDVSLTIEPGSFVSLVGPSGCGKTTLLRLIGGLETPTQGTIEVLGRSAAEALQDRAFGFMFQDPTLLPWRTVEDNASLLLDVTGQRHHRERVQRLIEIVGLTGFETSYPAQLSGGMRQRVALARALALEPEVLLMDEPFAALDAITRDRMGEELVKMWDGSRTVVFVTHSISEATLLSDRVVVLSARPGRVTADLEIDLPRPRDSHVREMTEFQQYSTTLRNAIEGTV